VAAHRSSIELIRAVRQAVNASIADCKAALEAHGGNVQAAIASLKTPEDLLRDRKAALFAPITRGRLVAAPREPSSPPTGDVLAAFERSLVDARGDGQQKRRFWVGEPKPAALAATRARYEKDFGRPFPALLGQFLARWNGFEADASSILWACGDFDPGAVEAFDEPECAQSFCIGEHRDSGYLFLRVGDEANVPVYFYDYSDPPPVFRIADDFESFLRDWIGSGLDLLRLIHTARDRHCATATSRRR